MKLQKKKVTSFDELPLILNCDNVKEILRVSKAKAYEIMKSDNFPRLNIGKRVLVEKEAFIEWLKGLSC